MPSPLSAPITARFPSRSISEPNQSLIGVVVEGFSRYCAKDHSPALRSKIQTAPVQTLLDHRPGARHKKWYHFNGNSPAELLARFGITKGFCSSSASGLQNAGPSSKLIVDEPLACIDLATSKPVIRTAGASTIGAGCDRASGQVLKKGCMQKGPCSPPAKSQVIKSIDSDSGRTSRPRPAKTALPLMSQAREVVSNLWVISMWPLPLPCS